MQRFALLTGTLLITLVSSLDDIFVVSAALCNLLPPLASYIDDELDATCLYQAYCVPDNKCSNEEEVWLHLSVY